MPGNFCKGDPFWGEGDNVVRSDLQQSGSWGLPWIPWRVVIVFLFLSVAFITEIHRWKKPNECIWWQRYFKQGKERKRFGIGFQWWVLCCLWKCFSIYSDNFAVCDYGKTIEKPLGRVWITDFLNVFQQIWVGYGYMDSVDGSEI